MAQSNTHDTSSLARRSIEERQSLETALVQKDDAGNTMLAIPPQLAEQYLVFAPAAVLMQGESHFRPAFTVIHLDKDEDFYPIEKDRSGSPKKFAMSKNGILKIANAAGIDFSEDIGGLETGEALPVTLFGQHVMDARRYVYVAIGKFRKSDGTWLRFRAEKEWHPQAEALAKEIEASSKNFLKTEADRLNYAKKEFLRSLETRSMMMKSKAQNAVMRHAFNIRQKYDPSEVSKPGFVVGYNFDAGSDPNALSILASLVGADTENLYGASRSALPEVVTDDGDVVTVDAETGEYIEADDAGPAEVVGDEGDMFADIDLDSEEVELAYPTQPECAAYVFTQGPFAGTPVGTLYHSADGRAWLMKVRRGFGRLFEEGTINDEQMEAYLRVDGYFNYQGE